MLPTAARRDLGILVRSGDAQGLRGLLEDERIARVLGGTLSLNEQSDDDLLTSVSQALKRSKSNDSARRELCADRESCSAAEAVARTVRWRDGTAYLDTQLVLGPLLAKPSHVLLLVGEIEIAVQVSLLRRAARATKVFPGRFVTVDRTRLSIRWRGGRGCLSFRPQPLDLRERHEAVIVVLVPPVERLPSRSTPRGVWLRDLLEFIAL